MHSYNVMDVIIVFELILLIFGLYGILNPEGWDRFNKRVMRWERRVWHGFIRGFKRVCRKIFISEEETV